MQEKIETITINNVEYVRKDSVRQSAVNTEGLEFCIVRTRDAGVFAGFLKDIDKENGVVSCRLTNSIRLWRWSGAASISQLSQEGVKNPNDCKFGMVEPEKEVFGVIEVSTCSVKAMKNIQSVPSWKI